MNLESSQVYGEGKYTNPPDHPAENKHCNDVIGQDLNKGIGFLSFAEAKSLWIPESPPFGNLYRINDNVYQVIEKDGKAVFDFYVL